MNIDCKYFFVNKTNEITNVFPLMILHMISNTNFDAQLKYDCKQRRFVNSASITTFKINYLNYDVQNIAQFAAVLSIFKYLYEFQDEDAEIGSDKRSDKRSDDNTGACRRGGFRYAEKELAPDLLESIF